MYAVVAMGGLAALAGLGLTGLAVTNRRVPLTAWLLLPLGALATGAIGSWIAAGSEIEAVAAGDAARLPELARLGYARALLPDWAGRWAGAIGMMIAAWGAGLGAVARSDDDTVPTFFPAGFALIATFVFSVWAGGYCAWSGLGAEGWAFTGLLAFGGLGVTIGSIRRHAHEHAFRVAGMRFASGLSLIFAITWAGRAIVLDRSIALSRELAIANSASYAKVLSDGIALSDSFTTLIWIGILGAWAIALANFFAELGEVVQKGTVFDMVGVVALLCVAFVVRAIEGTSTNALREIGDLGPVAASVASLAYDLPAGSGLIGDKVTDARPVDGGFGDVIRLFERKAENDDIVYEWKRSFKWTGSGWDEDETPLAEAQLTPGKPVLVVAKGGAPAAQLVIGVKAIPPGQALLLLRTNELQTEGASNEVLSRQGTMLPVQVGDAIDFESTLWVDGDTSVLFAGPIPWYGHGDDARKLYDRIRFAAQNPVRNKVFVVTGERTRVSDLVNQCLPGVLVEKEGLLVGNGAPCVFGPGLKAEIVTKAAETFTPAETPNLKYTLTLDKTLDTAAITPLFQREMGAVSFCAQRLLETTPAEKVSDPPLPPEIEKPLDGKLLYEGNIGYKGKIEGLFILDKSTLDNETLRRCINRRLASIPFPELVKPEVEPGKEAPPLPKFELALTFK